MNLEKLDIDSFAPTLPVGLAIDNININGETVPVFGNEPDSLPLLGKVVFHDILPFTMRDSFLRSVEKGGNVRRTQKKKSVDGLPIVHSH